MSDSGEQRNPERTGGQPGRRDDNGEPDVLLDIPQVSVDSVRLAVDGLDADVSLRARLANLLQLDAGVRVHLQGVELDVAGVHAEALLKVRLEQVVAILDRALSSIDRNPQIIEALAGTATSSIDDVNRAAQQVAGVNRAARQVAGPAGTSGGERPGGATDELGQQVGAIGAVADGDLRGPAGREPTGDVARPATARGDGLASGSGGGGERGRAERARERRVREQHSRDEETSGSTGGQGVGGRREGGTPGGAARGSAEGPTGSRPADREDEPGGSGVPSAAQLAEQAGETLRQAGRSVWEAIQGGMSPRRQQGR